MKKIFLSLPRLFLPFFQIGDDMMNNTIIGTAGHVDHGKTLLIKALTGIDTDRLKEEKKRGITIELGFAYLTLPSGEKAGIIDVPGHEKFIRNMLAGAGSVDVALLVVAADEGFMPQTREHLGILSMLGVRRGVIALTKMDLVDQEWLEMVTLDIEEEVRGTFLEEAPIIPVSSHIGEGLEDLKQCIFSLLELSPEKALAAPFRLPVDRVFQVDGFGTVVTGTLIEGSLSAGDSIQVYPSLVSTKARSIQVHGQDVKAAFAGQRVAVNLARLKRTDLKKGDYLGAPNSMENSYLLDVRLDIWDGTDRVVEHGSRLHFHHGAGDMLCRLILLEKDSLSGGESGYAQLRFSEPVAAKPGDRFVVRFYSPTETIGGGAVLDPCPKKHRRQDQNVPAGFSIKEKGTMAEKIAQVVLERSASFPIGSNIRRKYFSENPLFDKELKTLINAGILASVGDNHVVHRDYLDSLWLRCRDLLLNYHNKNPLHEGMRRDELRSQLMPKADQYISDGIIELFNKDGHVKIKDSRVAYKDFSPSLNDSHKRLIDGILKLYLDAGFSSPSLDEVEEKFPKEKKMFNQSFEALVDSGDIVMLTPQICMHKVYYGKALESFSQLAGKQGGVTLGEYRNLLNTSRKYAVALLEHFDRKGFTRKTGDVRVLLK